MDTSYSDVFNHKTVDQPKIARMINTFPESIWGDFFLNFKLDIELWEKYSAEDEELKAQVIGMLNNEERGPSEKMVLIDTFERLGVAYHFEDEIDEIVQQLFDNFEYNNDHDLYTVALHFRIFRQHGYKMSCDVFNKFKGSDGKLKETLINDTRGMLSLYEAAHLATHEDVFLDEALVFTKTRLQTMIPMLSSDLAEQVTRSLNLSLHRSLVRIEARNYIDKYEQDPLKNETLLRFAKVDFNLLQLLHRQEISAVSKWWKDIISKFPYARDRIVECYFWSLGVYCEPRYTVSRTTLSKVIAMISLLDDTFDTYGTVDELKLFKDAVDRYPYPVTEPGLENVRGQFFFVEDGGGKTTDFIRWDVSAIQLLPDYLKELYKVLLDLIEELHHQFSTEGRSEAVNYVKQEAQNLVRSYYIEAKWFLEKAKPSYEDYSANGLVTSSYLLASPASFLGMGEASENEEAIAWLRNKPKASLANARISRHLGDVATFETEKARGQEVTPIECYMYQYGISKEDAFNFFKNKVEQGWKDLNEECLKPTPVSRHFLERIINLSRLIEVVYRKGDGYTHPEEILKGPINSLLKFPIPIPLV